MNIIKLIIRISVFNLFAMCVFAQTNGDSCPLISVKPPAGIVSEDELMEFTAEVKGLPEKANPTFLWTVSAGTIASGQGTNTINVSTKNLAGQSVTATVEIMGNSILSICNTSASESGMVADRAKAQLIERMENPTCEYRQMMMDNFFAQLNNNPMATGYIFTFGSPRVAAKAEKRMQANLKWRKFDDSRIVLVNGGGKSKKPTIDYWLVPAGADIPKPVPPLENEADFDKSRNDEIPPRDPKEPFIQSSEYYDGGACIGDEPELDLGGYAKMLKDNPKSRGNIVILMMTKAEFRQKEKEILQFLAKKRIARKRLKTFYVKSYGGVELWFLP